MVLNEKLLSHKQYWDLILWNNTGYIEITSTIPLFMYLPLFAYSSDWLYDVDKVPKVHSVIVSAEVG